MYFASISIRVLLAATSAANANGTVAVIAVDECQNEVIASHVSSLRDALTVRQGKAVQSESETAGPLGGLPQSTLADTERLLAGARFDFHQGAYDRAERTLKTAAADLLQFPPSSDRWNDLREVYTLLANLYSSTGRRAEMEQNLSRILRVEPDYQPGADLYPPSLRKHTDAMRAQLKREEKVELRITSEPEGVLVAVEGKLFGLTPATVQLPQGNYLVESAFAGRRGIPRKVQVKDPVAFKLEQEFDGAVRTDRGPCLTLPQTAERRLESLNRVARVTNASTLIAVRTEKRDNGEQYLVASAFDAGTSQETREARVKFYLSRPTQEAIERLAEFLSTGAVAPPVEPLNAGPALSLGVSEPGPGTGPQRWVAHSVLAAGALAVAGGGLSFAGAMGTEKELAALRQPNGTISTEHQARYTQLNSQAGTQRMAAYALAAGGVLAVGGAVVLYVMSSAPAGDSTRQAMVSVEGGGLTVRF